MHALPPHQDTVATDHQATAIRRIERDELAQHRDLDAYFGQLIDRDGAKRDPSAPPKPRRTESLPRAVDRS